MEELAAASESSFKNTSAEEQLSHHRVSHIYGRDANELNGIHFNPLTALSRSKTPSSYFGRKKFPPADNLHMFK